LLKIDKYSLRWEEEVANRSNLHEWTDNIRFQYRQSIPTEYWPAGWFGSVTPLELGNKVHYDKLNGGQGEELPSKLQEQYPKTKFKFAPRGAAGPDVQVVSGAHPSEYKGSDWPEGVDYADFKPDTDSGARTFQRDIAKGKLPVDTYRLTYNIKTGGLNWPFTEDVIVGELNIDAETTGTRSPKVRGPIGRFFEWLMP
jgi:hypothetical protein